MRAPRGAVRKRSEEHTSEPSHRCSSYAVFCLKKKIREQTVNERPLRVTRGGMDDEPGRLVDDEEVLVLVRDDQLHLLRLEGARHRTGRLELELLAAGEPRALRARGAVHEHAAVAEQAFGDGTAADLWQSGGEAV